MLHPHTTSSGPFILSSSVEGADTCRYPSLTEDVLNNKLDHMWTSVSRKESAPWICWACFPGLISEPLTWLLMNQPDGSKDNSLHVKKWTTWPATIDILYAFDMVHLSLPFSFKSFNTFCWSCVDQKLISLWVVLWGLWLAMFAFVSCSELVFLKQID